MPRWTRRLAAGDPAVLKKVCHGLKHFHRTKIAPQLPSMSTTIARDVKLHSDAVTTGGFEMLAETLHPAMQWRAPTLHVDMRHIDRDLYLRGRGLRLVPSFFCWRYPIMPANSELPPVLVYPVNHDPAWSEPAEQRADPEGPWPTCSAVRRPPYSERSQPAPVPPANSPPGPGSPLRQPASTPESSTAPASSPPTE